MAFGLGMLAVFCVVGWLVTIVRRRQWRERVHAVVGGRPVVWSATIQLRAGALQPSPRGEWRLNLYGGWIEVENTYPGSRAYGSHWLFRSSEVRIEVCRGMAQPYISLTGKSAGRDVRLGILGTRYEQEAVWRALVADGASPVGAGPEALAR